MAKFVDAHIHLADEEFQPIFGYVSAALRSMNIVVCSVSMDLSSSIRTLTIAQSLSGKVLPFIGIHPWSAQNVDLLEFKRLLFTSQEDVSGIGEIGLDRKYTRNEEEYRGQKEVYIRLLELSEKTGKPVSIHSRGAHDEVIEISSRFKLTGTLLHWFSGDLNQLKKATDMGYFISFGPTLLYSKKAKTLALNTPQELILTETDGPVEYGACFGGRMALPTFLPSVTFTLSNILKMNLRDTIALV